MLTTSARDTKVFLSLSLSLTVSKQYTSVVCLFKSVSNTHVWSQSLLDTIKEQSPPLKTGSLAFRGSPLHIPRPHSNQNRRIQDTKILSNNSIEHITCRVIRSTTAQLSQQSLCVARPVLPVSYSQTISIYPKKKNQRPYSPKIYSLCATSKQHNEINPNTNILRTSRVFRINSKK